MNADMLGSTLDATGRVVDGVDASELAEKAEPMDWTVAELLAHIVSGIKQTSAGAHGELVEHTTDAAILGDDHRATYAEASAELKKVFERPEATEKTFTLPTGDTPGSMALFLCTTEVTVHGWDLARATDQDLDIDEATAEAIYGMTTNMMEPEGSYPRGDAFDEPIGVADDAPIQERMLAYLGRSPAPL